MRTFYEAWSMLDSNSAIATAELKTIENKDINNLAITIAENTPNSAIAIAELKADAEIVDIHSLLLDDNWNKRYSNALCGGFIFIIETTDYLNPYITHK